MPDVGAKVTVVPTTEMKLAEVVTLIVASPNRSLHDVPSLSSSNLSGTDQLVDVPWKTEDGLAVGSCQVFDAHVGASTVTSKVVDLTGFVLVPVCVTLNVKGV